MAWLTLNGIELAAIAHVGSPPKSPRREIGEMKEAGDGTMRITRQNRKRDLSFESVPLVRANAFAWEGLICGEGEVWSFDSSLYGSKGLGPNAGYNASIVTGGTPKFGGGHLRLPATTGTITFDNAAWNASGGYVAFTAMVWRFESGAWHHYIIRSDLAKWVDGVRNDAASTTWFSVSSGDVTLANTSGADVDYDDLVVLPYNILDAWAPIFGTALEAFSALPYLTAKGNLVPEAGSRRVLGKVNESYLVASSGGSRQNDVRRLEVELQAA